MDPLVFQPYFRPQIWGSRRLEAYLGRPLPGEGPYGEAWMLSAQALHVSRVAEGPLQGMSLAELWANRAEEIAGRSQAASSVFPLLVKILDCQELLSVQVHPNDAIAAQLRPGELGKTEAWVVIHAEPKARIYAGLHSGITQSDLERHLDAGTVDECLHAFVPQQGQCVFLPAGIVHAVGGGVLLAEVQQTSDVTFRLFDWNRLLPDGKPRALHRQEALLAIDWSAGPVGPVAPSPIGGLPAGNRGEHLVACPYFSIDRFEVARPQDLSYPQRPSIWMLLAGSVILSSAASGYQRQFRAGETVLVPASARGLRWTPAEDHGAAILLGVGLRS